MKAHVEFDNNHQPLVSGLDEIANRFMLFTLKAFFYLAPLTIGLHNYNTFLKSHLVRLSAFVVGFLGSTISWLIACVIPWFVFGTDYQFTKEVFKVYTYVDYRISIALVFLLLPLSRFLINILNKTITSYLYRKYIFLVISLFNLVSLTTIIFYMEYNKRIYAYSFSFIVMGIVYLILIKQKEERKILNPQDFQEMNDFFSNPENMNTNSTHFFV